MKKKEIVLSALRDGKIQLEGRFVYGSNYTFMTTCSYQDQILKAVYKPLQGEQPLWDFPAQTLAHREVAAFLVSEALRWELVPPTVFRALEAPMGPGSVQLFIDHDPNLHYFTFKDQKKNAFAKVMLFDLLINNADRKGGHLLIDRDGKLKLIDHGLCFHIEEKLRTVVWDYAGAPIPSELLGDVERFVPLLFPRMPFYHSLQLHLSGEEILAIHSRAQRLLEKGKYPHPPEDRRTYPWPLV